MAERNPSLIAAFKNAFSGVRYVYTTQRNARIHLLMTIIVVLFGVFFKISALQWISLVFAIGLVWAAECFNTGIEKLTDLASPEYHVLAKAAKDSAAAAVLMVSITAAIIGLIIFIPRLWALIR